MLADMKKPIFISIIALGLLTIGVIGCRGKKTVESATPESIAAPQSVNIGNETALMLNDLKENGDYVNSREFPALIKASVVYENLNGNIRIIDLRTPALYAQGHIQGAVNKKFSDLPDYFETGIKPFEFDKIIMVCDDGQLSCYSTSLLRLMGYGNVYAMRWGMSAWNKNLAETGWLKGVASNHEPEIEQTTHEKPVAKGMPQLNTGLPDGAGISAVRFRDLFAAGTDNIMISTDEVFANPKQYYIINYERKDKYDDGHIPGAVRYKPNATLGFTEEMATIPTDKTVVVYCGTGHNSGFVTAYLRLFGYDARTLKYGNNGFMYDKMVKDDAHLSWLPFSKADINDYATVK
jgi:rhodanese-related sulfurtransferase